MDKEKLLLIACITILLAANAFFVFKYIGLQEELQSAKASLMRQNLSEKTLSFTRLFVHQVLQAKQEVSFEERLKLENMVRDLNDPVILDQWNKFVNSKDQAQAQEEVKNLLGLLIEKSLNK